MFRAGRHGRVHSKRKRLAFLYSACLAVGGFLFLSGATPALAQYQPPSEKLLIDATRAYTWTDPSGASVVQLEGPVTIDLDRATLTARQAVIWLTRDPGAPAGRQRAEVVLLGGASVRQQDVTRSGDRLFVTAEVEGKIRFSAEERVPADQTDTPLYRSATAIRNSMKAATQPAPPAPPPLAPAPFETRPFAAEPQTPAVVAPRDNVPAEPAAPTSNPTDAVPRPSPDAAQPAAPPPAPTESVALGGAPTTAPTTAPATQPDVPPTNVRRYLEFEGQFETVDTEEGTVAGVFNGPIKLIETRDKGDVLELRANRAVLFTPLKSLKDAARMGGSVNQIRDAVTAVYLEGDVRVNLTPPAGPAGEQRLEARRVYYELATDRAILTHAVVHTQEPRQQIPVIVRARTVRQLSQGEYRAEGVKLSTSSMARPSYSVAADRVYVRNVAPEESENGVGRSDFRAVGAKFQFFDVPLFYLPYAAGSMSQGAQAFRGINFGNQNAFGPNVRTEWGLFETLGMVPPEELDVRYDLDYYGKRGVAGGLEGEYAGGFLTDVEKERWTFRGGFDSLLVYDRGEDDFGRGLLPRDRDPELRGQALWQHQLFVGDDYQIQLRAGWASDPNFLEQWYRRGWRTREPRDFMAYVKRQRDSEAYTFYANVNPNGFVTTSDEYQEQFEVEHLPEIGYRRLGGSAWDDRLTTFSENTVGIMRFNLSHTPPPELGFGPGRDPGLPAVGFTGVTEDYVLRGDFRQELDWPINAGRFKVVPYVVGRLTSYNDSPSDGSKNRLLAAAGARVSTAFWKVDDTVESRLFDLHRLRHVIEPELNVFTSAATVDRGELFIYEEDVDKVTDLSAAQVALRQRWQTKRGGAGRWRNVDAFTLDVEGNFFANQPKRSELAPTDFRGLYFASIPEASVPRNSINADATWRVSDNTVVLADAQYNLDDSRLATAAIGLVVQRGDRLNYYVGTRYIDVLNSNITTIAGTYQISPKYTVALGQSYDFGIGQNVASSAAVIRRFDRFLLSVRVVYNSSTDESGFGVNFIPTGTNYGLNTDVLGNTFRPK